MRASKFWTNQGPAEPLDRLTIEGLGGLVVAYQRARSGLDPEREVGAAGPGSLRQSCERLAGQLGVSQTRGRLDEFGQREHPDPRLEVVPGGLRRRRRLLVAREAVVEDGRRPVRLDGRHPLASDRCLLERGLDHRDGLGLVAPQGHESQLGVRRDGAARRRWRRPRPRRRALRHPRSHRSTQMRCPARKGRSEAPSGRRPRGRAGLPSRLCAR